MCIVLTVARLHAIRRLDGEAVVDAPLLALVVLRRPIGWRRDERGPTIKCGALAQEGAPAAQRELTRLHAFFLFPFWCVL